MPDCALTADGMSRCVGPGALGEACGSTCDVDGGPCYAGGAGRAACYIATGLYCSLDSNTCEARKALGSPRTAPSNAHLMRATQCASARAPSAAPASSRELANGRRFAETTDGSIEARWPSVLRGRGSLMLVWMQGWKLRGKHAAVHSCVVAHLAPRETAPRAMSLRSTD